MVSRISRLSVIRKASRWTSRGIKWHFHLFSPNCLLNPTKRHELVLESENGTYFAASHVSFMDTGKSLLHLLDFAQRKGPTSPHAVVLSKVLMRARRLSNKKIRWHNHLLLPKCAFNKLAGKWVIVFEDLLNNKITKISYQHYPQVDLLKFDELFYSQH
ncbi:MAG: hypothetical protein Q8R15_00190 [Candidatus Micrarchaeota archaeon]|nr:hypothetical protein [Candidatus Micrarchaeota archaeon]